MLSALRKYCLVYAASLLCVCSASALTHTRTFVADTVFHASPERTQQVLDSFILGLQTDIDSLFTWAFLGTDNQGDDKGSDAIRIHYTGNTYNPTNRVGQLTFDVYVLGVAWGKNLMLEMRAKTVPTKWYDVNRVDFLYSGSALQSAYLEFKTRPVSSEHTRVYVTFSLTFGTFFSLFITDNVWHNVIEWRAERFVANLAEYAETGKVSPLGR